MKDTSVQQEEPEPPRAERILIDLPRQQRNPAMRTSQDEVLSSIDGGDRLLSRESIPSPKKAAAVVE